MRALYFDGNCATVVERPDPVAGPDMALVRVSLAGICLDAEGAIWVASPISKGVLRVREGGEVLQRIAVEHQAYACMLGGADRRTLYICTAETHDPAKTASNTGRIESVLVDVPGAGLP